MNAYLLWAAAEKYLAHTAPAAAVLAVFVTVIAYIHHARVKAMVFSMPVPFTLAYLVTGMPVNPTHLTGLGLSVTYHWVVYLLRVRLRAPLALAMAAGLTVFLTAAPLLRPLKDEPFFGVLVAIGLIWACVINRYEPRHEEGYRSSAPLWLKVPSVFFVAVVIYGFAPFLGAPLTSFPYAGTFTSYEMRRCLRTLAGQYTINAGGLALMMLTVWLLQGRVGPYWALAGGWVVSLSVLSAIYWRGIGQATPPETGLEAEPAI